MPAGSGQPGTPGGLAGPRFGVARALHQLAETETADERDVTDLRRAEQRQVGADEAQRRTHVNWGIGCGKLATHGLGLLDDALDELGPVAAGDPELLNAGTEQPAGAPNLQ